MSFEKEEVKVENATFIEKVQRRDATTATTRLNSCPPFLFSLTLSCASAPRDRTATASTARSAVARIFGGPVCDFLRVSF